MKLKIAKKRLTTVHAFVKGVTYCFILSIIFYILNFYIRALLPKIISFCTDYVLDNKKLQLPKFLLNINGVAGFFEKTTTDISYGLLVCAILIAIISVVGAFVTVLARVFLAKGSENMLKRVRDKLYHHVQRLSFDWHVKNSAGDIIQRCTSDVEVVRNFVCIQLLETFKIFFIVIINVIMMFDMNTKLSLVALAFVPCVVIYSCIFYGKISKRFLEADEAEADLTTCVQENLSGVRVVRAFGREKFEVEKFDEKNNLFANLWIKLGYLMSYYWAVGDLFSGLQIVTILILGIFFVLNNEITLGEYIAFVMYNSTLVWPIRALGRILSEMSKAGVSIDRLEYILDEPIETNKEKAEKPLLNKDITFKIDNFAYNENKTVLKNIDFTIKKGETFGILGGTGCGKSTLMYLLDRLYDLPEENGKITIGDTDIKDIDLNYLRENIGIVLQEPFLFSKTIEENIKISSPEKNHEEIRHIAGVACIDNAIIDFAKGYDTIVGEKGVTLSGGQKQRVAIARMLLKDTPIKIFDDSLSAVDAKTDAQIRKAIKENTGDSTVILISHRITTLMQADNILVMENGKIAQMGNHEQLITEDGIYKQIYDIQLG